MLIKLTATIFVDDYTGSSLDPYEKEQKLKNAVRELSNQLPTIGPNYPIGSFSSISSMVVESNEVIST